MSVVRCGGRVFGAAAVTAAALAPAVLALGPQTGGFNPTAALTAGGHKVNASGTAPACAHDERIFLSITITQGKHSARGAWGKHACTGRREDWKATAIATSAPLHKGNATGHAVALIKRAGKTATTRRWSAKLTLKQ